MTKQNVIEVPVEKTPFELKREFLVARKLSVKARDLDRRNKRRRKDAQRWS